MRKTVIDIGTNTMLMLIADYDETNLQIKTLDDIQRVPRLGKGVDSNRNILPESIEKAVNILSEYKKISNSNNSASITATATSFIRDSNNKNEFIEKIQTETGIRIEILSGPDEARWTFWGGVYDRLQNNSSDQVTTIDIGGGSTEISTASGFPNNLNKTILLGHQIKGKSLDVGSVRLNEKFLNCHPPAFSHIAGAEMFINEHLDLFDYDVKGSNLIGVAGTITTLGAIKLDLNRFIAEKVDGLVLSIDDIERILNRLSTMKLEEIYSIGNYMEGRADIIIPGTLILKCFMNKFGFEKILVSTKGLRYGIFLREIFNK
jgi:exopolyphosphatase / guanosine-5'-triphosphate,3'-diphosphate pyrophosphatase